MAIKKPPHRTKKVTAPKASKKANRNAIAGKPQANKVKVRHVTLKPVASSHKDPIAMSAKTSFIKKINATQFKVIDEALSDKVFYDYVINQVDPRGIDILKMLAVPHTDDAVAEKLAMKINDVRKILNILNSEGIARYIVNKNSKGWLTFRWYINEDKLIGKRTSLHDNIKLNLPELSNDFFVCNLCFKENKKVYLFDDVYDSNFKCNQCNKNLQRVDRGEVSTLLNTSIQQSAR
jgi:transcription initiation factor IIE alpha subunit